MAAEAVTDTAGASAPLKAPLHARHVALGARMVPFAGYDMPVQYPAGVLKEHLATRTACDDQQYVVGDGERTDDAVQ